MIYCHEMLAIEQALLQLIASTYERIGWPGVIVLMAIESACIPLPSEIIMPLAGWMLIEAQSLSAIHNLEAGFHGALGCTIGSLVAYAVGAWGGKPFLEKYGKYLLISRHDLYLATRWFERSGSWTVFISRLLPVVRTFISLPAGIAQMNLVKFVVYSFLGSFIWCASLSYGGYLLGENWEQLREVMRPLDPLIGGVVVILIGIFIYRHLKHVNLEHGADRSNK